MNEVQKSIKEHMQKVNEALDLDPHQQFKTITDLLAKSIPTTTYYILLILSSVIITIGLLLNNTPIVIGGMLVTPLLTPILVIALGISVGEFNLIARTGKFVGYSCLYVMAGGLLMTVLFGAPSEFSLIENTMRTSLLYFVVALASGMAATFAWIKREISDTLPGIAIAVSLVPPLSLIGIGLGMFNFEFTLFYFTIFVLNILGILMGSLIVFNLSKFHRSSKIIESEEAEIDKHIQENT